MTFSDFVTATLSGTARVETKVGTINVKPGGKLTRITFANRTFVGAIQCIRLDYTGVKTPKKFLPTGNLSDATGTEVVTHSTNPAEGIEVSIPIPSNCSQIDVYAAADVASTKVAVGLEWE